MQEEIQNQFNISPPSHHWGRILGLIILLLILAGAGAYYFGYLDKFVDLKTEQEKSPAASLAENQLLTLPPEQLPEGFPEGITFEGETKILHSSNAGLSDGRLAASRTFESSKTVLENFEFYKNLLTKEGWKINNTFEDQSDSRTIFASKADTQLTVSIGKNLTSGIVTVDITATFKR